MKILASLSILLSMVALQAAPVSAQSVKKFVKEGDWIPNQPSFYKSFLDIGVLDRPSSPFLVISVLDSSTPSPSPFLTINGFVGFVAGGLTSRPNVFTNGLPELNTTSLCAQPLQSIVAVTGPMINPSTDRALFYGGGWILIQEGDPSAMPGLTTWSYVDLLSSVATNQRDYMLLTNMSEPGFGIRKALVLVDMDTTCSSMASTQALIVHTGQQVAGQALSDITNTTKHMMDRNVRGDYMYVARFESLVRSIVLNGALIATEGQPIPGGLGNFANLGLCSVDLNDLGDYVFHSGTSLSLEKEVIVKNGSKFIQVLDSVPDPGFANFTLLGLGDKGNLNASQIAPVLITNSGDVIWYGEWDDPDTTKNEGIFINNKLLVQEGVTTVPDGSGTILITGFGGTPTLNEFRRDIAVSPNGRYLVFDAITNITNPSAPNQKLRAVFYVDLGESLPYGTVAQGCSYQYPAPVFDHLTGRLDGTPPPAKYGLPLIGKRISCTVSSGPTGTASTTLVVKDTPDASFPCGTQLPFGEYLLGSGPTLYQDNIDGSNFPVAFLIDFPPDISLVAAVGYMQVFFKDASGQIIGATNGIRMVIGQ